jgi:hypothetical protein
LCFNLTPCTISSIVNMEFVETQSFLYEETQSNWHSDNNIFKKIGKIYNNGST